MKNRVGTAVIYDGPFADFVGRTCQWDQFLQPFFLMVHLMVQNLFGTK